MIIADTGFWVALLFRNDDYHADAERAFREYGSELVTTWPVLTEACHLLGRRVAPEAAAGLLEQARVSYEVWDLPPDSPPRAAALMHRYLQLPMDLADASLVLLAEHLGHGRILSTDGRDFGAYRWKHRQPFENLLLS